MAAKIFAVAALLVASATANDSSPLSLEVEALLQESLKQEGPLLKKVPTHKRLSLVGKNLRVSKRAPPAMLDDAPTWSSDFEKDVMDMVLGLSKNGLAGTPFGGSVQKVMDLIDKEMMPKVMEAHALDQQELYDLAADLKSCGTTKNTEIATANGNHATYMQHSTSHKACRGEESALYTENVDCHAQWRAAKEDKILKCKAYADVQDKYGEANTNTDIVKRAASEDVETYVRRISETICGTPLDCSACGCDHCSEGEGGGGGGGGGSGGGGNSGGFLDDLLQHKEDCEKATKLYNDLTVKCKNLDAEWHEKRKSCDNIQDEMDTASCSWASQTKDACEAYMSCYAAKKGAYDIAVNGGQKLNEETGEMYEAAGVKAQEKDRHAEWKGLKRMLCIISAFLDGKVEQTEIDVCRNEVHDVSHLVIDYPVLGSPQLPDRDICTVPNDYPNTANYKEAEFDPLPTNARGKVDGNECVGLGEISTTPAEGSPETCGCDRVTMNGPFSPGPLVVCRDCLDVRKSEEKNSCPIGTKLFSPRSRQDWDTFVASTDAAALVKSPNWIIDVTMPEDGCDGCYTEGQEKPNANSKAQDDMNMPYRKRFVTSDGSPWWMRSEPYEQPSGDYFANCYMDVGHNLPQDRLNFDDSNSVTFDDSNCNYHSKSYYCQKLAASMEPKEGSPEGCVCKRVELTGEYTAQILIRCEKCLDVHKSTQVNSCPSGSKLFSPRTREDWKTFINSAGPLRSPHWIIDITRPQNGCGGCTEEPMKSGVPAQATWGTSDTSPWWLRESAYSQPNGDYEANCYLDLFGNPENENSIVFDDDSCNAHSRSYYCQSLLTTTTTTTTTEAVPEPVVSDATTDWDIDGRKVYLFKTGKGTDVRTQTTFCTDKNLNWWAPKSQEDAQKMLDESGAAGYTTILWTMLYQVPMTKDPATVGGYSVSVNSGGCVGVGSGDWTAIRKHACSMCDPGVNGYSSSCWDSGNDYGWFLCEEVATTTTQPQEVKYWVDDGCHTEGSPSDDVVGSFMEETGTHAGPRCCNDAGNQCTSPLDCPQSMTWAEAQAECEKTGHRLCTKDEILTEVCCGTGGNCDSHPIWTSTSE